MAAKWWAALTGKGAPARRAEKTTSLTPEVLPDTAKRGNAAEVKALLDKGEARDKFESDRHNGSPPPAVTFLREERLQHPMAPHRQVIKRIYSADNEEAAKLFLRDQHISELLYYIEVDTPSGRFGIDNGGRIYDGKGQFLEVEAEPEKVTYDLDTLKMKEALESAMGIGQRKTPPEITAMGEASLRCLRIIIEDASADFFLRRMALWWGGQFGDANFVAFLNKRFVEGKDRATLYKKSVSSQSETADAELGLHIAAVDVLTGQFTTSDKFLEQCLAYNWVEVKEFRRWDAVPELREIVSLANAGNNTKANELLEGVWSKYETLDFVYYWKAELLWRLGNKLEAKQAIEAGLVKAHKKFPLCSKMASIEYEDGDVIKAFFWWVRAATSQVRGKERPVMSDPFIYLAYIAELLNETSCRNKLFDIVDSLHPMGRLNGEAVSKLTTLLLRQYTDDIGMREILLKVCQEDALPGHAVTNFWQ